MFSSLCPSADTWPLYALSIHTRTSPPGSAGTHPLTYLGFLDTPSRRPVFPSELQGFGAIHLVLYNMGPITINVLVAFVQLDVSLMGAFFSGWLFRTKTNSPTQMILQTIGRICGQSTNPVSTTIQTSMVLLAKALCKTQSSTKWDLRLNRSHSKSIFSN